ncbi:hypothetical protein EVAR_72059_1 [Eumeta japonica]|uniref:Uncharacterized protein n=1 Tax=Eumeta variegata TaxID=151549 RepID=A0A4C1T3J2_EUMVA|nr:hypothetical protein EVAR_72059_1 [Eumeta japonica]
MYFKRLIADRLNSTSFSHRERVAQEASMVTQCPKRTGVTTHSPLIKSSNEIPRRLPTVEEGCGFSNNSFRRIVGGEVSKKRCLAVGSFTWLRRWIVS